MKRKERNRKPRTLEEDKSILLAYREGATITGLSVKFRRCERTIHKIVDPYKRLSQEVQQYQKKLAYLKTPIPCNTKKEITTTTDSPEA